jgi:predicted metal-dependent hydrolase
MSIQTDFDGVRVVRSKRRTKTVSATVDKGVLVVRIPARMSRAEEARWVQHMRDKLLNKRERHQASRSNEALEARARRLAKDYFGNLEFRIDWSKRQNQRWGSCTPLDATIRLSESLKSFPDYVIDYVIVHELAHLLIPDHSPAFWQLLARYPLTDRARGFLEGITFAENQRSEPES